MLEVKYVYQMWLIVNDSNWKTLKQEVGYYVILKWLNNPIKHMFAVDRKKMIYLLMEPITCYILLRCETLIYCYTSKLE